MSNILLNHFYCLRIIYISLPFFIYFYFLLFFFFFAPKAAFLPSRYEPIYLLTIRHLKFFLGAIVYHRTISFVRHVDRRLRGRDEKGNFTYSPDFTNAYYHPITSHTPLE